MVKGKARVVIIFCLLFSDTDFEYEQIKSKLNCFETVNSEVEDFEDEKYLVRMFVGYCIIVILV